MVTITYYTSGRCWHARPNPHVPTGKVTLSEIHDVILDAPAVNFIGPQKPIYIGILNIVHDNEVFFKCNDTDLLNRIIRAGGFSAYINSLEVKHGLARS
jgi:hypothetical protein